MYRLFTFDGLKLLTVGVSFSGMLCMGLAGMIPPGFLIMLGIIHLAVYLFWFDRKIIGEVPAVLMIALLFGMEVYRVSMFGRGEVVSAVRDLIIAAALVRLLTGITDREIYQIAGIAFAECLLSTIFTTSPLFLIGLGMMIVLLPMLLYQLDDRQFSLGNRSREKGMRHWFRVWAGIVLTACLIFYLLPRPASSIIQHGLAGKARVTLSDSVDLRNPVLNEGDDTIVMRIVWSSGKHPQSFYLSGARLEGAGPDGFAADHAKGAPAAVPGSFTDRISLYPSALYSDRVFFPYRLYRAFPGSFLQKGTDYIWSGDPPPAYDVWVDRNPGREAPCSTDVPPGLGKVASLGRKTAGTGDAAARAGRIASYLRSGYRYSLKAEKIPAGFSSIEWFVLTGKKGRCEHFAAASAVMLRGCGIPARVVTGFLVNEYNRSGDYFIVRAADAHAWVEFWDGSWHILDATPPQDSGASKSRPLQIFDELKFRWYRWVIRFSLDDQIQLASKIFIPSPIIARQVESCGMYAMYLVLVILAVAAGGVLFRKSSVPPYEKVCRELKKRKIAFDENTSHREHACLVESRYPSLGPSFNAYLERYLAWRFGSGGIDIKEDTRKIINEIRTRARQ